MEKRAYVLSDMTWPEVEEALKTVRVAIIPTGANEQHGPHLVMRTDIANATSIALRIAQQLYPKVLLVPSLPFGISPHHMAFPGTISLRPESFLGVVQDIITSLKEHGINKFFIVNGHGGNNGPLTQFMLTVKRDLGVDAAFIISYSSGDIHQQLAATSYSGHADDVEVSESLYLTPELVRKDNLTPGKPKDLGYRHAGKLVTVAAGFHERTENGCFGDATKATYETGEKAVTPILNACIEFLEDFIGHN